MKKIDKEKIETILELFKNEIKSASIFINPDCEDKKQFKCFGHGRIYFKVLEKKELDEVYNNEDKILLYLHKTPHDEPIIIDCSKNYELDDLNLDEVIKIIMKLGQTINTTSTSLDALASQIGNSEKWF